VRIDKEHISFEVSLIPRILRESKADDQTAKIGSLVDVNESQDAEGLRVFYYLVQDLKVCHSPSYDCVADTKVLHLLTDYTTFQD
jgi:hypothetical protein